MKQALIRLEQGPEVRLELFDQEAPGTVANFEKLANSGFYNGLAFQRVVRGFVAQGGCPDGNGRGGTDPIPCETQGIPISMCAGRCLWRILDQARGPASFYLL